MPHLWPNGKLANALQLAKVGRLCVRVVLDSGFAEFEDKTRGELALLLQAAIVF